MKESEELDEVVEASLSSALVKKGQWAHIAKRLEKVEQSKKPKKTAAKLRRRRDQITKRDIVDDVIIGVVDLTKSSMKVYKR